MQGAEFFSSQTTTDDVYSSNVYISSKDLRLGRADVSVLRSLDAISPQATVGKFFALRPRQVRAVPTCGKE
jgi:hypothetical protein